MKRKTAAIATLVAVLATSLSASSCADKTEPPEPVTVAWSPFESLGLFFVAEDQGFFADNGLDVTARKYDSGAAALNGMLAGEADIVVGTTEFPLVNRSLQKADARIIATIARSETIYIVGRSDRGLAKPSDLKGKSVGTTKGTIAEFYLGRFLEINGLSLNDITLVDLKTPAEWVNSVVNGDIDAVCTSQPYANQAKNGLGANAINWPAQSSQGLFSLAITSGRWAAANPELAEKFLASLKQAEEYATTHPAETMSIVQAKLELDNSYMELVKTQTRYALTLDQSLIVAMEDETRWLIANNLTTEKTVPNFLDFIYEDALKQVKPDVVRIIR